MRYFHLLYDYENDADAISCESDELYDIDRYDVEQGNYVNNWDSRITMFFNPKEGDRETDFLGNDLGWLIISEKLKLILEDEKINGIQFLPLKIKNQLNNTTLNNYYLANICNLVKALDLENSDYNEYELDENEKVISVKKHAIKADKIKNIDIFRLEEDKFPVFVSEKFVNLINAHKATGFDFTEVLVV